MIIPLLTAAVVAAASPVAVPDPATIAAARALVQQLDIQGQVNRSLAQNVEQMRSGVALRAMLAQQTGFAQAYSANRARFDAALKSAGAIQARVAEKVIRENAGAIAEMAVTAYARNYSAAEIEGLSAFFKTPLGAALNTRQPRVTADIGAGSTRLIGDKIDAGMKAAAPQLQAALAPLNSPPAGQATAKPATTK
jgi:hypothetical protein